MERKREACIHFSDDDLQTCDMKTVSNKRVKVDSDCVDGCPHYKEESGAETLKIVNKLCETEGDD